MAVEKRGTFYARGARRVTYRQPDHSSGFVIKGQCGAAAVACVFRVQSITLCVAGRMPKMGFLGSLKKALSCHVRAFCSSGCRLYAVEMYNNDKNGPRINPWGTLLC